MQLDRFDLADIHHPAALAGRVHELLGPLTSAVPVVEIARTLDIVDVRLAPFDGFEGMLLTDAQRSTGGILANTARGARRARFSVAHELGHFLMERHQLSDAAGFKCAAQDMRETRAGRQHLRQETQANQFAIELLAPNHLMTPYFSNDPDLSDAQQLRDHLNISLEACVRQIIAQRDEPLAAVWSYKGQVRYSVRGEEFPFVALNKGDRIPQTSAAFQAITKGQPGFTQFVETDPQPWTGRSEPELFEQTRVAIKGHAVTMLWAELSDEDDANIGLEELGTPQF